MREYYIKDKNSNVVYRGFGPDNDINCLPFDYFRMGHANNMGRIFCDILKVKSPIPIPDDFVMKWVLKETDKMIDEQLNSSTIKPEIKQLLTDDNMSWNMQCKQLNGLILNNVDILWLNKEAQELGYLMDVYHEETYPHKFDEKRMPHMFHQNKEGKIIKIGSTNMTDGEMKAYLQQRKVVQARIYHKEGLWHCFYFTYKGLSGLEGGMMGSKPHYHYLSDKSGVTWDSLMKGIRECKMPSSKVHLIIEKK